MTNTEKVQSYIQERIDQYCNWYDVKAVFSNESLETTTFNGSLDKKLSIEEILDIIIGSTNSTSINYEINNKTILLK